MNIHRWVFLSFVACTASFATACGGDDGTESSEDDITASSCPIVDVRTGKKLGAAELKKLTDPVAKRILAGAGCPKSYEEIAAKLEKTDAGGCKGARAGITTRVVSERSQVLDKPDSYRAVVTRACSGRSNHQLFMSLFGIQFKGGKPPAELPEDVELMGFDATKKVYNYYTVEGGKWTFFGNSLDLIEPGAAAVRRCASCHTGGGPIMKELNSPWVHWEGDTSTPGADTLVNAFESLGSQSNGIELESTVSGGNNLWNSARIAALRASGKTSRVLAPLFCTVEANVQAGGFTDLSAIPNDFLMDPAFGKFEGLEVNSADYTVLLKTNDQRIVDGGGAALKGKGGVVIRDTFFKFAYPERSGADLDYVAQLQGAGIVDDDLVRDVLMIDFTRPVFSETRCGLLEFVPDLEGPKMTAAAIKAGMITKLGTAGGAPGAAELLASLKNKKDSGLHDASLDKFVQACQARTKKALLVDAMTVASGRRNAIRERPIMEFSESLPVDKLAASTTAALDPVTCKLVK